MVYYAYAKYVSTDKRYYRYIIAAPNAETIDEWWREASSSDKNNVVRLSPDFYTWSSSANVWDLAPEMADKIMIAPVSNQDTYDYANFEIFHQPERVDVVSGKSFYIRSKSNPQVYWIAKEDVIYAGANVGRTRFTFRIDGDHDDKKTVLIGSDQISIAPVGGESNKYVSVSESSEIVLNSHSCRMYYSDLKRNFLAQGEIMLKNPSFAVTKVEGQGEEWELVQ